MLAATIFALGQRVRGGDAQRIAESKTVAIKRILAPTTVLLVHLQFDSQYELDARGERRCRFLSALMLASAWPNSLTHHELVTWKKRAPL